MARSSLTAEIFLETMGDERNPEDNREREVESYLTRSEAVILSYTSSTGDPADGIWIDSICSAIQFDVVNRVYSNPMALSSDAMGPQNQSFAAPGGIFLLPAEREQLDKIKQGRKTSSGIGRIRTSRPDFTSPPFRF